MKNILDFLHNTNMTDCKVVDFPFPKGLNLSNSNGEILSNSKVYRRIIDKLLYLNMTRPDISFAIQQLSQFLFAPGIPH